MSINLTYTFNTEEEMRAFLEARAAVPAETPASAATPAATDTDADSDAPTRSDTDADGMPYSEDVHSDPPAFTADGLWRAKRGKAEEAKAARAAFKAAGGTEEPPADIETRDAPAAVAAPSAPGAAPSAPPPVTLEAVFGKVTEMLESGELERSVLFDLYRKTTGLTAGDNDIPALAGSVYQTNETARAQLMAALDDL